MTTRIDELLAETARRAGTKSAVVAGRIRYSYADLDLHVSRLASAFAQRQIGVGDRVALLMDGSYAAVVTLFAAARVGATLLPLDVGTGAETLSREIARARAAAIITEARFAGVTAEAVAEDRALRLVVLSGADRSTCSESCLSFEATVSGLGPAAIEPFAPAETPAVAIVAHPEDHVLSHRDLAAMGAAENVDNDALVPVFPSLASRACLAAVIGAVGAGATLVAETAMVLPRGNRRDKDLESFKLALAG